MTVTQKISNDILTLVNQGVSPIEALKQVCGVDVYNQMVDSLYNDLKKAGV